MGDGRDDWIPARQALSLALPMFSGDDGRAKTALSEWATTDLLPTWARRSILTSEDFDDETVEEREIPPNVWERPVISADWASGNMAFQIYDPAGVSGRVRLIDIHFSRAALEERLGVQAPAPLPPPAPAPAPAPATAKDHPPISEATLNAWWTMCLTMKSEGAWSADDMRTFYDRCFPDKYLSRDRLRDLRSQPKSGPKPKSAE